MCRKIWCSRSLYAVRQQVLLSDVYASIVNANNYSTNAVADNNNLLFG